MKNEASFQRLAAITSLLATLLACGSIRLQAVILGVTTDPFAQPNSILASGANGATLFRWGLLPSTFKLFLSFSLISGFQRILFVEISDDPAH